MASGERIPPALWRPLTDDDLDAVDRIAAIVHPDLPEQPDVATERLALFPAGCFAAIARDGVIGYALTHPARYGAPPPLDSLLGRLPPHANALHLHDVALLPAWRGAGLGGLLIGRLMALAEREGLRSMTLIAVHGSAPFWSRHGFVPVPRVPITGRLGGYGADAIYMVRRAAADRESDPRAD